MNYSKILGFAAILLSMTSAVRADGGISAGGQTDTVVTICQSVSGIFSTGRNTSQSNAYLCTVDGATIAAWTLFRVVRNHESTLASQAFLNHADATVLSGTVTIDALPAAYCKSVGGNPVTYMDKNSVPFGVCEFSDRSAIDTHALLTGPKLYPRLAAVLKHIQ